MGNRTPSPLHLLADALRGVGAPFGAARQIEFNPPLPGGVASAQLCEPDYDVLEALYDDRARARLSPGTPVLSWHMPGRPSPLGFPLVELTDTLNYKGEGVWELRAGRSFRLLGDRHITPPKQETGVLTLFHALQGSGERGQAAHSIVTLDHKSRFEAVCEIATYHESVLELGAEHPDLPPVQEFLKGPKAKTTVLSVRNTLTDEYLQFDLPTLMDVRYHGDGVFELPSGLRFGVVALRPVTPEIEEQAACGFVLPPIEFRPPSVTLH